MGGKSSLILVMGFAFIVGYINFNIFKLTNRAMENMIGYSQLSSSRNLANAGANIGLAILNDSLYKRGVLASQSFTSGYYQGSSYTVRIDSLRDTTYLLRSISSCTTSVKNIFGQQVVLNDTVEVTFSGKKKKYFSQLGWMTVNEGNIFFITGDTMWGKVHSNSNIHIDGRPVFMNKVTTSGKFDPKIGVGGTNPIFKAGYETGVPERKLPANLNEVRDSASNSNRTSELFVELVKGTGADNDGYVIIKTGSYSGTKVDSIRLSAFTNTVIYSSAKVHVKGTLDGRLSIVSGLDIIIEDDIKYETPPTLPPAGDGMNTTDMLGLIAENDVVIANNTANNGNDLILHASIFCRNGSFQAADYNTRGKEGTIQLIGSIAQKDRGAVGNFASGVLKNGYLKNYRYDPRLEKNELYPPAFPSYINIIPIMTNWWESPRNPVIF